MMLSVLQDEVMSTELFPGFEISVFRKDRDMLRTGKKEGGGMILDICNPYLKGVIS